MNFKPYSSTLLALAGFLLVGIGIYFVFLRPPLLPEDFRYMQSSLSGIENGVPRLSVWLQKVFWVMGGYIFTTGLFTIYIALTSFRTRATAVFGIVVLAGITSIGCMTAVNFILGSDFKWVLLSFTLPWIISLALYKFHK